MKKSLIIGYLILVITSFLYFNNKFEVRETGYNKEYITLKNNSNNNIHIKNNLKQVKIIHKEDVRATIIIKDNNKKILLKDSFIPKELKKNGYYIIDLSKYNLKRGNYNISFKGYLKTKSYKKKTKFNYKLELDYKNNKVFSFYLLYIIISIVMAIVMFLLLENKNDKLHILFIKIAFPIFILYLIFIPMLMGHDEGYHFIRAYEISEGVIIPDHEGDYSGAKMPSTVDLGNGVEKYSQLFEKKDLKLTKKRHFISAGSIDVYSPVQYIPQVIGICVSRLFTKNVLTIAYSGRVINMIFCIILMSLSIKLIPSYKKVLFLFAFSPLLVESFTTLSGDGIVNSISFVLIAYILSLSKKDKISKKSIILLSVLSSMLALCKIVYIVIPFLILIIPSEKYKDISRKKSLVYILMFPIIINLIWLFLAGSVSSGASPFSVPSKQLMLFLHNPFVFIKYLIYQIEVYGFDNLFDIFGRRMLMCQVVTNNTLVPIMMLITSFCLIKQEEKIKLTKCNKKYIFILLVLVLILVNLSVFIFYIPYRQQDIYIVQGRYFFPVLPLIIILIGSLLKPSKYKNIDLLLYYTIIVSSYMSIIEIIVNFI